MITSTTNKKVKELTALTQRAKARRETGLFIAEGTRMFWEAPKAWIREVYLSESFLKKQEREPDGGITRALGTIRHETVSDEVFRKISDTQTPQGILTVLAQPRYGLEELLRPAKANTAAAGGEPLFLLLEDLQDPGNLGTIFRAGEGAGVSGVIMTANTADVFNPKVIRSTMGSIYRVPFLTVVSLEETIARLKAAEVSVYAAHLQDSTDYTAVDYTGAAAFLIGNENSGLRQETADLAAAYIKIPMEGQVESLNAAVAASILMYEAARQRRGKR
ncbi:MAG: RNA methyltransferase [Roseburia sp.]|nr:RNA methyltransferase [Roseburia sp.]